MQSKFIINDISNASSVSLCYFCNCPTFFFNHNTGKTSWSSSDGMKKKPSYSFRDYVRLQPQITCYPCSLPLSLKSSTRMISSIRLSGVRLIILCMVRRREVQPSLWNGIMMLVFGSLSRYILCLQLGEIGEEKMSNITLLAQITLQSIDYFIDNDKFMDLSSIYQAGIVNYTDILFIPESSFAHSHTP